MKIGVVNVIQDDNKVRKCTISLQKTAGNTSNHMPPKCKHYIQSDGIKTHYWNKEIDKLVYPMLDELSVKNIGGKFQT